jgi:hypothetical protein
MKPPFANLLLPVLLPVALRVSQLLPQWLVETDLDRWTSLVRLLCNLVGVAGALQQVRRCWRDDCGVVT